MLTFLFLEVEAWVGGLSGGYGGAQFDTAAELRIRTLAEWSSFHASSWRDMVIYVPVYVALGTLIILSVRPHYRKLSKSWLLKVLHIKDVPRVSLWAMIALVGAGLADIAETALFRESLRRLREFHETADIDTLTVLTRWMTLAKVVLGLTTSVLLVLSIASRGVKPILSRSEVRKIVKGRGPSSAPTRWPHSLSGHSFQGDIVSGLELGDTHQNGDVVALGSARDLSFGAGNIRAKQDLGADVRARKDFDPDSNVLVFYVAAQTDGSASAFVVAHALELQLEEGESLSFPRRVSTVNGVRNTFVVAVVSPPADDTVELWLSARAWMFNADGLVELPADRVTFLLPTET